MDDNVQEKMDRMRQKKGSSDGSNPVVSSMPYNVLNQNKARQNSGATVAPKQKQRQSRTGHAARYRQMRDNG